jgi:hypothetical protein
LSLKLLDAVFALDAPLLRQLAVSLDEIARVRHRQLVAVHASIATVTDLTTDASIANSLRVSLTEIGRVGRRAFAVTLATLRLVPSVASLAKRQVLSGFTDMDADEVLRVRHFRAMTVGAKLLLVTCLATLQPFLERLLCVPTFNSSAVPCPSPQNEIWLFVGLGLGADVAVIAKLLGVASYARLMARFANSSVLSQLIRLRPLSPSARQFAVPLQEVRCLVALRQSALVAFIARLFRVAVVAELVHCQARPFFQLAEFDQLIAVTFEPFRVVPHEFVALFAVIGRVAGVAHCRLLGGVAEVEFEPLLVVGRRSSVLVAGLTEEGFVTVAATCRVLSDFKLVVGKPVLLKV